MAFSVYGNEVRSSGGKTLDTAGSHSEAIKAAKDRAKGGTRVTPDATAGRVVFYEMSNGDSYRSVVDIAAAMAADLASETDPKKIATLILRSDPEITATHAREVKAVKTDSPFVHGETRYPAGSWVVKEYGKPSVSYTAEDFSKSYVLANSPAEKPKAKPKPFKSSE